MVHNKPLTQSNEPQGNMNGFTQETDSKIIFPLPTKLEVTLSSLLADETFGGETVGQFLSLPEKSSLVASAWQSTKGMTNQKIARKARKLLSVFHQMICDFQLCGFDLGSLSSFSAVELPDGSALVEWIFNGFRIGFTIELNMLDSGWYLIAKEDSSFTNAYGNLRNIDSDQFKKKALWLLNFALSHS